MILIISCLVEMIEPKPQRRASCDTHPAFYWWHGLHVLLDRQLTYPDMHALSLGEMAHLRQFTLLVSLGVVLILYLTEYLST